MTLKPGVRFETVKDKKTAYFPISSRNQETENDKGRKATNHACRPARTRPKVLQEWKRSEAEYLTRGYSRHYAHVRIAELYGTSDVTVWRHLRPKSAEGTAPRPNRRERYNKARNRLYSAFRYDPVRYVAPLFSRVDEVVSLEELSVRMRDAYGYLPRIRTLERLVTSYDRRIGGPVLEGSAGTPDRLYRLTKDVYDGFPRRRRPLAR